MEVTSPFEARIRSHLRVRLPRKPPHPEVAAFSTAFRLILRRPPQAGLEGEEAFGKEGIFR